MNIKTNPFPFTQSIDFMDANPLMQGLSFYERNTNWRNYTSFQITDMYTPEKWFTSVSQMALAPFVVGQKQIQLGLMQYMDWLTLLSPPTRQPVAELETPAAPEPAPAPAQVELAISQNDLTNIKGIGPSLAQKLNELGIHSFAQIAAWTQADIDRLEASIIRFPGRIEREDWIGQAKALVEQS